MIVLSPGKVDVVQVAGSTTEIVMKTRINQTAPWPLNPATSGVVDDLEETDERQETTA